MRYDTKQKRLWAIADYYLAAHKRPTYTAKEVAEWAMAHKLYPVPTSSASILVGMEWEDRLRLAIKNTEAST